MTPDDIRADAPERIWDGDPCACCMCGEEAATLCINAEPWCRDCDQRHTIIVLEAKVARLTVERDVASQNQWDIRSQAQIAELEAENKRLRDGIAYVLNKHPYGRLKRLMGDVLDGINPEKTEGSESRWNDRVSAAEAKAQRADWALSKVMDALKEVSAIVGEKP
jgi:hypothetical protein